MACSISSGIGLTCPDLRRVAGVFKKIWLFNTSDLRTTIDVTQNFLTNLNFNTYALLYAFEGKKYTHLFEEKGSKTEDGNGSYEQTLTMKIFNTSYQEDQVLEALLGAEVGAILLNNNREFFVAGAGNGLDCSEQNSTTGTKIGDPTSTTVILKGTEQYKAKRLIMPASANGDSFQSTMFYLNALTNLNITT